MRQSEDQPQSDDQPKPRVTLKQIGWLVLIWALSVGALGIVGWLIRLAIKP